MIEILKQMLNILIDIASTLKHIEQQLSEEKQHKVIKDAVSHALVGEKFTPKDLYEQTLKDAQQKQSSAGKSAFGI